MSISSEIVRQKDINKTALGLTAMVVILYPAIDTGLYKQGLPSYKSKAQLYEQSQDLIGTGEGGQYRISDRHLGEVTYEYEAPDFWADRLPDMELLGNAIGKITGTKTLELSPNLYD